MGFVPGVYRATHPGVEDGRRSQRWVLCDSAMKFIAAGSARGEARDERTGRSDEQQGSHVRRETAARARSRRLRIACSNWKAL